MPLLPSIVSLAGLILWIGHIVGALKMPNTTLVLMHPKDTAMQPLTGLGVPRYRRKHHISARDMNALLDYHNHIRANVHPPAANMEYMVWDERLARSAKAWATQCIWAHGPSQLMKHMGQNLSIHSGRYRSVVDLVKSWSAEKQHYSLPASKDCTPHCPWLCSGPVCSHYTQVSLAFKGDDGVGILQSTGLRCTHTCSSINVWGSTWQQAVYLVCNYAIKGNWIGEAPYKIGKPCSACPPVTKATATATCASLDSDPTGSGGYEEAQSYGPSHWA